jgi:Acetoacetate decarboxylase (ADC)
MEPVFPYNAVNLVGTGVMRAATIALPKADVLALLPYGLELGAQDLTAPDEHPVVLFFQEMIRAHMTIPTLLPNMTYHEQIVGIPFTYVTRGYPMPCGPFFYMANLYLDELLPTIGGKLGWGFTKQMANVTVTADRWAVTERSGDRLISLDFAPTEEGYQPVEYYPNFERYYEPVTGIMTQPLVSQLPAAIGPFFACSNFDKKWDEALVRPLRTAVTIDQSFVPALPCGRFPHEGYAQGIDASRIGSFEVKARWRLGLIYPCSFHPGSPQGR